MKKIRFIPLIIIMTLFIDSCTPLDSEEEIIPSTQVVEIPIVFHIWDYGLPIGSGPNISVARINNQLSILNRYFADAKIKFRLAKTDPSGNSMTEPGINRIRGRFISSAKNEDLLRDKQIFNQTWNPNFYVNIFVSPIGVAAAFLPESLKSKKIKGLDVGKSDNLNDYPYTFGLIIPYNVLNGDLDQSNSHISATVHEMGHHFGLSHIFSTDCRTANDYCDDTFDYQYDGGGTNFLVNNRVGCNGVSYQPYNIMDYLPIQNRLNQTFTNDQISRMRQCISGCYFLRNLYKSTK